MDKVKIGLAGCGSTVQMHLAVGRYLQNGEFTALMDIDERRVACIGKQYGIDKLYTDYEKFLEESGVDAVIVGSPTQYHARQVIDALTMGKHVLCEKPMARTMQECRDMIECSERSGRILMLGFMKRFDRSMRKVKEMITSREIGDVYQVTSDWSWWQGDRLESWRDSRTAGGGLYQDHGSHVTDLCRWWLGEIDTVSAEMNIIMAGREVEDNAVVTYKHASGIVSVHLQSRMTHRKLSERYLIDGSRASVEILFDNWWSGYSPGQFALRLFEKGKVTRDITFEPECNLDDELRQNGKYRNEISYFCDCIRMGRKPEIATGHDGLKATEAITAAYLSSCSRQKVQLPLATTVTEENLKTIFEKMREKSPRSEL